MYLTCILVLLYFCRNYMVLTLYTKHFTLVRYLKSLLLCGLLRNNWCKKEWLIHSQG